MVRRALVFIVIVACGQERIAVTQDETNDYNHGEVQAAVDKFVAAKRTPEAYSELANTIFALRPGMDRATAEEAEMKLTVLALGPIKSFSQQPMDEQIDHLALTVWPALLAKEIEADEIIRKRDDMTTAEILPAKGEAPRAYLQRLCGKVLAADCKQIVPEFQGHAVAKLAIGRATERARVAVADCVMCSAEPGWAEAIREWETLDREASSGISEIERKADPANWPIAGDQLASVSGDASEPDPGLPIAEINTTGEVIIAGQRYGAKERIGALAELGKGQPAIALHLRPDVSLATVKGILSDATKARAKKVAVIARGAYYPWERRIYWISEKTGARPGLRATDTLQLLLHSIDHHGPGTIGRVE